MDLSTDLIVSGGQKGTTQLYQAFTNSFENVWHVTRNGALKCDLHARERTTEWFNGNKIMIMLITGVDVEDLVYETPGGRGDIGTTNANKSKMLAYYALSFTAYVKYCQTIKREMDRRFLPKMVVEKVESMD